MSLPDVSRRLRESTAALGRLAPRCRTTAGAIAGGPGPSLAVAPALRFAA